MFINREVELARLGEAVEHAPQLVVVRGRRRIGKSMLLDRSLEGRRSVFFQADEQPLEPQLALLAREAAALLPGVPPIRFGDWDEALRFFGEQAKIEPLTLVLDEFQWLLAAEPHLDSILQRHWDAWARQRIPLTVMLSGSALSLMERLLDRSNPLFGRADYRPLLMPLDYRRAAEFVPGHSQSEKIMRYAVLGGTPQYQAWAGAGELSAVLRNRILAKGEALHEEPLYLLRTEKQIRDPGSYFAVVAAVARGKTRLGEIASATGLDVPNLSKMTNRLVELGYLEQSDPVSPKKDARRAVYRISDPYFRFWFRFIFPNRSRLGRGRITDTMLEIERDLPGFVGPIFEDCCRVWLGRYATDLPEWDEIGSWWSRDGSVEIDIAGLKGSKYSLLGSCKWSREAPAAAIKQLIDHRDHLGPAAMRAQLMLFARGFSPAAARIAAQQQVTLVPIEALFPER